MPFECPRITPADAGKTVTRSLPACFRWDHPRGCGENRKHGILHTAFLGSPPRMRGKPMCFFIVCVVGRITPADAGKTWLPRLRYKQLRDHPRGCGENARMKLQSFLKTGSPPRMRGKPYDPSDYSTSQRITPADAGKTAPKDSAYLCM